MRNSELKDCPYGCHRTESSITVRGESTVMCAMCGACGPCADTVSRRKLGHNTPSYAMGKSLAQVLWNIRGAGAARRVDEAVRLWKASNGAAQFEAAWAAATGGAKPASEPGSSWRTCVRDHKTLMKEVDYKVNPVTHEGKPMLRVRDNFDQDLLVPPEVFAL